MVLLKKKKFDFYENKKKRKFFKRLLSIDKIFSFVEKIKDEKGDIKEIKTTVNWLFKLKQLNNFFYDNSYQDIDNFEYTRYKKYSLADFDKVYSSYKKNYIYTLYDKNKNTMYFEKYSLVGSINRLYNEENCLKINNDISRLRFLKLIFEKCNFTGLNSVLDKNNFSFLKYSFFLDNLIVSIKKSKNDFLLLLLKFFSKDIYFTNNNDFNRSLDQKNYIFTLNSFFTKNYFPVLLLSASDENFFTKILKLKGFFLSLKTLDLSFFVFYSKFNLNKSNYFRLIYNKKYKETIFFTYFSLICFNWILVKNIINVDKIYYFISLWWECRWNSHIKKIIYSNEFNLRALLNDFKKYVFKMIRRYKSSSALNILYFKGVRKYLKRSYLPTNINCMDICSDRHNFFDILVYKKNFDNLNNIYKKINNKKINFLFILKCDYIYKFFIYYVVKFGYFSKNKLIKKISFFLKLSYNNIFSKFFFQGSIFKNKSNFYLEKPYDFYIGFFYLYILKLLFLLKINERDDKFFYKDFEWYVRKSRLWNRRNYFLCQTKNDLDKIVYERPFYWLKNFSNKNSFCYLLSRPNFLIKFIFNFFSFNERYFYFENSSNEKGNKSASLLYSNMFFTKYYSNFLTNLGYNNFILKNFDNIKNVKFIFNFFWKSQSFLQSNDFFISEINSNKNYLKNSLNVLHGSNTIYNDDNLLKFLNIDPSKFFRGKLLNYLDFLYHKNTVEYNKYSELRLSYRNYLSNFYKIGLSQSHFSFFSFFNYSVNNSLIKLIRKENCAGDFNVLDRSFFNDFNFTLLQQDEIKYKHSYKNEDLCIFNRSEDDFELFYTKKYKKEFAINLFLNGNVFYNPCFLTEYEIENKKNHFYFNYFDSFYFDCSDNENKLSVIDKSLFSNLNQFYLSNFYLKNTHLFKIFSFDEIQQKNCNKFFVEDDFTGRYYIPSINTLCSSNNYMEHFLLTKDYKKNLNNYFDDFFYNFFYKKIIFNFFFYFDLNLFLYYCEYKKISLNQNKKKII